VNGLRRVQRDLYLGSRLVGDVNAGRNGPEVLARRIVKRAIHRRMIGLLRRARLW
jgi:hypothetical protein